MLDLPMRAPGVGMALARATESLLRALGGDDIHVLFPLPMAPDSSAQLGLTAPAVNELTIAPSGTKSFFRQSLGAVAHPVSVCGGGGGNDSARAGHGKRGEVFQPRSGDRLSGAAAAGGESGRG